MFNKHINFVAIFHKKGLFFCLDLKIVTSSTNCQLNLTLITGKINERKSGLNNNLKV